MHQCLLFSSVFLVFVILDVAIVVNTAEAQDDDLNLKTESAFSEVIKNITRVNSVLQDLIKNYEKLQKIYHSQESIEQQDYDEENSSKYDNVQRSKNIPTHEKSKDFPATNLPYSELEGSQEKESKDNIISKEKSDEGRVTTVETLNDDSKNEKVKITKQKEARTFKPDRMTSTSGEITDEKLAVEKKQPINPKNIDEQEYIKNKRSHTNPQEEKKAILEHASEESRNLNTSDAKPQLAAVGKVIQKELTPLNEGKSDTAKSESKVQFEQHKLSDNTDKVYHRFAKKTKGDVQRPALKPKLRSAYHRFSTKEEDDTEKPTSKLKPKSGKKKSKKLKSNATVRSSTQKKEKSSVKSIKLSNQDENQVKKESEKKSIEKEKRPKKRSQKDNDEDESSQKDGGKRKKSENGASSEDEKSIKKEQFKTSILRKAYGDACLKVVLKKCYKACKIAIKHACRMFKCKSNFQLQFKEHSKAGCIHEFREPTGGNVSTTDIVNVRFEDDKRFLKSAQDAKLRADNYTAKDFDGFSDLTRSGYLAAACLPKTRRTETAPGTIDRQLNILRDRFERECQKVSRSKCNKACAYAVDKTCSTHNCVPEKKKGLKKSCRTECKKSYTSKFAKNKSTRSSKSCSSSGSDDSLTSDSSSDTDTDSSLEEETPSAHNSTMENTLRMRAVDTKKSLYLSQDKNKKLRVDNKKS